jgi:hypothetical protein
VVDWRGNGPKRERLSVCLCIGALGVNVRIMPLVARLGGELSLRRKAPEMDAG